MFDKLQATLTGDRPMHRPAVDLQITCGRKNDDPNRMEGGKRVPIGTPVDKDRFFFMHHRPDQIWTLKSRQGAEYTVEARSPYPGLEELQGKQSVRGVLLFEHWDDVTTGSGFKAYRPPGQPAAPGGRPWCSSPDGEKATRWMGKDWQEIACPNRACPFFMADRGCKVSTNMIFALDEDGYPRYLTRWSTGSIYTFDDVVTFKRTIEKLMKSMRLPAGWYGVPFRLAIRMKATPKGIFPVQSPTPDGDISHALTAGYQMRAQLGELLARAQHALTEGDAYPETDDLDLGGPVQRVLSAPAGLPRTCPDCGQEMAEVQGRKGIGWGCKPCGVLIGPDGTKHRGGR